MLYYSTFDFAMLVDDWQNNDELFSQYEAHYGRVSSDDYRHFVPYKYYISRFEIDDDLVSILKLPLGLEEQFDFSLLLQLTAASLASEYELQWDADEGKIELLISATSQEHCITKKLSDLYSFQIEKCMKIYFTEQMRLHALQVENDMEYKNIENARDARLALFAKTKAEFELCYMPQSSSILDGLI